MFDGGDFGRNKISLAGRSGKNQKGKESFLEKQKKERKERAERQHKQDAAIRIQRVWRGAVLFVQTPGGDAVGF